MSAQAPLLTAAASPPFPRSIGQQLLVSISMGISLTALYMFNGLQEFVKALKSAATGQPGVCPEIRMAPGQPRRSSG